MDNHNFRQKSSKELKELADYYAKLHKEALEAFRSDRLAKWDKKAKEYMEKQREIDQILREREDN